MNQPPMTAMIVVGTAKARAASTNLRMRKRLHACFLHEIV